jgi:ABC-type Mn2+/Zn2+ transport system ATPase subunit
MSDGERQKVMLVRAISQQTPVILMDEPTAFLDYPSKKAWWTELLLLVQDGKTIFMSTHDIPLVPLHHPLVEALCFHTSQGNIEHVKTVSSGELEVFFDK